MSLDNLIWGEILDGARIANEVCTATKIALKFYVQTRLNHDSFLLWKW